MKWRNKYIVTSNVRLFFYFQLPTNPFAVSLSPLSSLVKRQLYFHFHSDGRFTRRVGASVYASIKYRLIHSCRASAPYYSFFIFTGKKWYFSLFCNSAILSWYEVSFFSFIIPKFREKLAIKNFIWSSVSRLLRV